MKLKEDLNLFFNHFENFRTSIINTNYSYSPEISQSVLLCSIIDTISNVAYHNSNLSNNQKFTYFVDDFSGWENVDRISLVQLFYYLNSKSHYYQYDFCNYYLATKKLYLKTVRLPILAVLLL